MNPREKGRLLGAFHGAEEETVADSEKVAV
jgi:hypothetical protein